jgi:hypothetical protein
MLHRLTQCKYFCGFKKYQISSQKRFRYPKNDGSQLTKNSYSFSAKCYDMAHNFYLKIKGVSIWFSHKTFFYSENWTK